MELGAQVDTFQKEEFAVKKNSRNTAESMPIERTPILVL